MTDLVTVIGLVIAAGGDDSDIRSVRIDGDPWSKGRPRHTRQGRTYTRPEDVAAEARTRTALANVVPEPMTGNVAMAAIFYRPNRQRIDADNMLKHICDSATGVIWHDDSQATAVLGVVELDAEHPRTLLAFAPHDSTLGRGTDWTHNCVVCSAPFVVNPRYTMRRFCGDACAATVRSPLAAPVPCAQCASPFRRKTSAQTMCSKACRDTSRQNAPRSNGKPYSRCGRCDTQLTHRRGGICRACFLTSPAAGSAA